MNTPRYKLLRGEMYAHEMDQQALASKIGRSRSYVGYRLTGKYEWTMADVYAICRVFNIPFDRISEYFPPPPEQKRRIAC